MREANQPPHNNALIATLQLRLALARQWYALHSQVDMSNVMKLAVPRNTCPGYLGQQKQLWLPVQVPQQRQQTEWCLPRYSVTQPRYSSGGHKLGRGHLINASRES